MPCDEFESRLIDYAESPEPERRALHEHLAGCASCREFFDALQTLDQALTASFSDVAAPDWLGVRIRAHVESPSRIPEMLDALGWLGISALIASIAWYERVTVDMTLSVFAAAAGFLIAGFWVSLRLLAKSES
jgi:predicted anti-sigma-YlaC factor YlaD